MVEVADAADRPLAVNWPSTDRTDPCPQAVFPKSDEQRARLSDAVQGILLFRALDPVSTEGRSAHTHSTTDLQ